MLCIDDHQINKILKRSKYQLMKHPFVYILLAFLFQNCSGEPSWKLVGTNGSCSARHECGFVANKNALYLIGGRGEKPIDKFTPATNTWTSLNPTPIEMHHITPVSLNNYIYIVSGLTGQYPKETPLTHIYRFDPEKDIWETIFEIPKSRRRGGAGVTIHNNKIYVVNGISDGHTSGTSSLFDVYDPIKNTWKILPNSPAPRDHCAAVTLGDSLISIGGRNTSYHEPNNFQAFFNTVIDTVDYFDFKKQSWHTFKIKLPNPAAGAAAVILHNELYFFGGETKKKAASNKMFCFKPIQKKWIQKSSLKQGRHGTNAVVLNDHIYIASGSGNQGGGPELTSIEVYNK